MSKFSSSIKGCSLCCYCFFEIEGRGNNPDVSAGRLSNPDNFLCCDECNSGLVIAFRLQYPTGVRINKLTVRVKAPRPIVRVSIARLPTEEVPITDAYNYPVEFIDESNGNRLVKAFFNERRAAKQEFEREQVTPEVQAKREAELLELFGDEPACPKKKKVTAKEQAKQEERARAREANREKAKADKIKADYYRDVCGIVWVKK